MVMRGRNLRFVRSIFGTTDFNRHARATIEALQLVDFWYYLEYWSMGPYQGMGAVIVAFGAVAFTHVSVIIVALTASLPFRILIPTSNIGRTNLLLHWCCVVGFRDCIEDFQVFRRMSPHMRSSLLSRGIDDFKTAMKFLEGMNATTGLT